ncbi:unnamed protein product [Durusdinium trenchii]|uniref:Pentatricopeptide repeat-containing protein n=1 Tax=Durusdinium trenchii TaxID=1381693 RepID=A0ABP0Q6Q1_9DINO
MHPLPSSAASPPILSDPRATELLRQRQERNNALASVTQPRGGRVRSGFSLGVLWSAGAHHSSMVLGRQRSKQTWRTSPRGAPEESTERSRTSPCRPVLTSDLRDELQKLCDGHGTAGGSRNLEYFLEQIMFPEVRNSQRSILRQILRILSEKQEAQLVYTVLEAIRTHSSLKLEVSNYVVGISTCAKAKQWQEALKLFETMPKSKIQPDVISYSAAISACEKGGQWRHALRLFQAMPKATVQPDVISYNASIRACEKGGQWWQALKLLVDMPKEIVHPSVITYSAAISACEKGGQWQQALTLFEVMPKATVQPNIVSYSAAISACEKGGQWQQALKLFEAMPNASIQPNIFSYSAAISACEKGRAMAASLDLV